MEIEGELRQREPVLQPIEQIRALPKSEEALVQGKVNQASATMFHILIKRDIIGPSNPRKRDGRAV